MGNSASVAKPEGVASLHDLKGVKNIDGQPVDFEALKGKVVLVVNVASKCGYTEGDYAGFKELHDKFRGQPFEIVGFPCNQFLKQEAGSCVDIKKFAASKGFEGMLMDKINVNGKDASPVYNYLKVQSGKTGSIKWNFTKFLVDKTGTKVERFGTKTAPPKLIPNIEQLLAQ
jgi:glutathione peroxidase